MRLMVTHNRIHRDIFECFVNLGIGLVQNFFISLDSSFPNAVVYYVASEVNVGNILQINIPLNNAWFKNYK